nr:hypothetical protein [Desulfovibrio sp.]
MGLLHFQTMPGDIENGQPVFCQPRKRVFPLLTVPFFCVGQLNVFFRLLRDFLLTGILGLILFPLLGVDGTHRLRGYFFWRIRPIFRVITGGKIAQFFAQFSHAESAANRGCFHGNITHKYDCPGPLFLKT